MSSFLSLIFSFRAAPKDSEGHPNFTNCIVTCYWADGVNRTPPVLFTYNQDFRTEQAWRDMATPTKRVNITALRRKKIDLLTRFMDGFGISAKQVVVLPRSAGKKKAVYCKESEVIINRFFQIYKKQISRKTVMFHDSAKFFDTVCGSLINEGLLGQNVEYPSAIHQHLSPNDNILHGAAKATWRNSIYYEGKHVEPAQENWSFDSFHGCIWHFG